MENNANPVSIQPFYTRYQILSIEHRAYPIGDTIGSWIYKGSHTASRTGESMCFSCFVSSSASLSYGLSVKPTDLWLSMNVGGTWGRSTSLGTTISCASLRAGETVVCYYAPTWKAATIQEKVVARYPIQVYKPGIGYVMDYEIKTTYNYARAEASIQPRVRFEYYFNYKSARAFSAENNKPVRVEVYDGESGRLLSWESTALDLFVKG